MNRPKDTEVPKNIEVPKNLLLASMLSIGITVTTSVSCIILSTLGLVYRFRCDVGDAQAIAGSGYFFNLLYRTYIQKDDCDDDAFVWENLTQTDSVFILNIITLCASVLCCVVAIVLMTVILNEEQARRQLHLVAYLYVAVCVASLVVDLTFATHFGMDYTYLTNQLNLSSPGLGMNYERDLLRLGAFLLMTVCLKGFVASAINCVLLVLICIYVVQYRETSTKEQHSIHKLGLLNAYEQTRRPEPWHSESNSFYRGSQINPAYIEDTSSSAPRSPREPNTSDYSRSDNWKSPSANGARPFSYLEEPKRPATTRGVSNASESAWGRDWPAPPVPAPDYSPHTPRRLKPALKPYM